MKNLRRRHGAKFKAQVHALGGDRRLADALRGTQLVTDLRDNDFALSVIRFFIRNPMLDTVQIAPIIDYIWHQKYDSQLVLWREEWRRIAAPRSRTFP